jgi:hypothetical protein
MPWFRVASNRLQYRGRLSREPFVAWARTPEGYDAVDARAQERRLFIFAHSRTQRRLWKELDAVSRGDYVRKVIESETDHFLNALVEASHAPGLPRRTVALHRMVIVPRAVVAARARTRLRKRLYNSEALAAVDAHVRDFFCDQLVRELDAAMGASRPSVSRPVLTHEAWGCVGRDTEYRWVDPMFSGDGWGGHLLMFEFPRDGLSRRHRKEVEAAVNDLQNSLSNISPLQRDAIIRIAVDGLPRLVV